MRVLYVALTRAKDALFMSMNASRPQKRPADWILNKVADLLGRDSQPLPALLECCQSFGAWSLYSLLSHPESSALRVEATGIGFAPRERHKGEPFTFEVCDPPEAPRQTSISTENLLEDEQIVKQLKQQFDWQPPAYALQNTPAKVSVTALVHGEAGEGDKEEFVNLDRPVFLQKDRISAVERGTATHAFMQHIDWNIVKQQGLEAEIERQQQQAFLLPEVAEKLEQKGDFDFL
ncbi:recombination helicase AddA [gut metagenome]|uniref:Recombination helicase AddA n=1 Tax=gut metagenome TaxID=749906 RepID=J9GJ56_9ZZZZ